MLWSLIEVVVGGCLFVVLARGLRTLVRHYQRCTIGDSNAPRGRYVDWDMFWGRRPR